MVFPDNFLCVHALRAEMKSLGGVSQHAVLAGLRTPVNWPYVGLRSADRATGGSLPPAFPRPDGQHFHGFLSRETRVELVASCRNNLATEVATRGGLPCLRKQMSRTRRAFSMGAEVRQGRLHGLRRHPGRGSGRTRGIACGAGLRPWRRCCARRRAGSRTAEAAPPRPRLPGN